ncbi:hypothetical protein DBR44_09520 [Aquitalea sp. FJL05]|uniref:nucleoid-associated protein n=1 Tax=Aquitalea sp. FJL05 TaxID=2153366 RepID=UPI000F595567|nr:nucleoid-associated protein [Aquitalea sp. FJL05]RQO73145.1 hypothetical protein DBR44_09520 [Aquitalea sp. FJL05]
MSAPEVVQVPQFRFEGLMIQRIIVHRIYTKVAGKEPLDPKTSNHLVKLAQPAIDALQLRITKALGNKSHGIEMSIHDVTAESFFQTAASMLHADEASFIKTSKELAINLHKAQLTTNTPGGMLAIIAGRVGDDALPFIAAIKAETQDGFKANEKDDQVDMEYIAELLLTDTQRFYKIGLLTEHISKPAGAEGYQAGNYRSFLFDHLMTATETRPAAAYFYRVFLGMDIQASSKKLTEDFFEYTRDFIKTAPLDDNAKLDLHEALRTELRSQEATISAGGFGAKHLPAELRKEYEDYMTAKGFPANAINKDTDYIHAKLRKRRRFVFTNGVWISTPPEKTDDFLQIEPADDAGITVVKIKGAFQEQQ